MIRLISIGLALAALATPAMAQVTSESMAAKGKGIVTCAGGTSAGTLFNRECKTLSISRVSVSGGAIKYEITCTDSGNTTFLMACDAFAWEQKQVVF